MTPVPCQLLAEMFILQINPSWPMHSCPDRHHFKKHRTPFWKMNSTCIVCRYCFHHFFIQLLDQACKSSYGKFCLLWMWSDWVFGVPWGHPRPLARCPSWWAHLGRGLRLTMYCSLDACPDGHIWHAAWGCPKQQKVYSRKDLPFSEDFLLGACPDHSILHQGEIQACSPPYNWISILWTIRTDSSTLWGRGV